MCAEPCTLGYVHRSLPQGLFKTKFKGYGMEPQHNIGGHLSKPATNNVHHGRRGGGDGLCRAVPCRAAGRGANT